MKSQLKSDEQCRTCASLIVAAYKEPLKRIEDCRVWKNFECTVGFEYPFRIFDINTTLEVRRITHDVSDVGELITSLELAKKYVPETTELLARFEAQLRNLNWNLNAWRKGLSVRAVLPERRELINWWAIEPRTGFDFVSNYDSYYAPLDEDGYVYFDEHGRIDFQGNQIIFEITLPVGEPGTLKLWLPTDNAILPTTFGVGAAFQLLSIEDSTVEIFLGNPGWAAGRQINPLLKIQYTPYKWKAIHESPDSTYEVTFTVTDVDKPHFGRIAYDYELPIHVFWDGMYKGSMSQAVDLTRVIHNAYLPYRVIFKKGTSVGRCTFALKNFIITTRDWREIF